jgi:hypothetical protein
VSTCRARPRLPSRRFAFHVNSLRRRKNEPALFRGPTPTTKTRHKIQIKSITNKCCARPPLRLIYLINS